MVTTRILLRAYYERLHETMVASREELLKRVDVLLDDEIQRLDLSPMEPERIQAYREACVAFVDERINTYDPVGVQYTFDRSTSRLAAELEFQLDWYNSRAEFQDLVAIAQRVIDGGVSDETLGEAVDEVIRLAGAFPDRSIIAAYTADPTDQKLPDYVVALAIERVICRPK